MLETSCLGCTQCFTGANGNVQSYGFGTAQFLYSQQYSACFRQELGRLCLNIDILVYDVHVNFTGYCSIQFRESSITSPDPFGAYFLSFENWCYTNRLDDPFCNNIVRLEMVSNSIIFIFLQIWTTLLLLMRVRALPTPAYLATSRFPEGP